MTDSLPLPSPNPKTPSLSRLILCFVLITLGCVAVYYFYPFHTEVSSVSSTITAYELTSGNNGPVVETASGKIRGFTESGVNKFLGIPYAEPPIGERRWKRTVKKAPWTKTLKATNYSAVCPQSGLQEFNQSEDCLYLNVWAPSWACETSKLPVLFWIHGGGLSGGTGSYAWDGSNLAKKGNIVVTINYRLGVFGWIGLPELQAEDPNQSTGNYGLNDVQVALKWVQQNIKEFGGDKKSVNLWGQSAGCNLVLTNLASPLSKGLFARAICQSGAYQGIANPLSFAIAQANYIANKTNCTSDSRGILPCLRSINPTTLVTLFRPCANILPTIDNYQLTDKPYNLITADTFNDVPLLMGINSNEGSAFTIETLPVTLTPSQYAFAVATIAVGVGGLSPSVVPQLLSLYPLSAYPSPWWAATAIFTEIGFICPTLQWVQKYSTTYPRLSLYLYEFAYNKSVQNNIPLGAPHNAELNYVWQGGFFPVPNLPGAQDLADTMQTYWRAFAESGNANDFNRRNTVTWPKYKLSGTQQNIVLDSTVSLEKNLGLEEKCAALAAFPSGGNPLGCTL